ncbi:MAG: SDR family NAD(P)-dependent oxidoreductase [Candidatus Thiosymbion ectosymbiont of Robbea hypermnestra]|nr:SDR family NAD(P)-dependent oxidoreductase [Candidatus Thiosymbion ectosymbiont of Robbea hypermnestra]
MENYQPPPDLLAGRVILVTGAAAGIGHAVAAACARHGATLILSDQEQRDLEPLYDRLEAEGAPEPAILPLDLEHLDANGARGASDLIGRALGRLDGFAHCAAFAPFLSRLDDYDASAWERVLRINLTAPFLLTQACLPLLRAADDASVVFTADRAGRRGMAYWGAYCAAKFGLEGLMQTLAEETRDSSRIRVNSIDPGIVRTGLRARLYPGENPADLPGPETVTGSYLYLLGPHATGATGQCLQHPVSQHSG